LTGNVFEFCLNEYLNPKSRNATAIDLSGLRGSRGGSWLNNFDDLRVFTRCGGTTAYRAGSIGFRVAQDVG
jgi:formylglycine-generating enzyme required for sulfatase activity